MAYENAREKISDQTLFAVRVISTYVTFYKVTIPAKYPQELNRYFQKSSQLNLKDGQVKIVYNLVGILQNRKEEKQ